MMKRKYSGKVVYVLSTSPEVSGALSMTSEDVDEMSNEDVAEIEEMFTLIYLDIQTQIERFKDPTIKESQLSAKKSPSKVLLNIEGSSAPVIRDITQESSDRHPSESIF